MQASAAAVAAAASWCSGIVFTFVNLLLVDPEDPIALHPTNTDIAVFQRAAAVLLPEERAVGHIVHAEALVFAPVGEFTRGRVLYKMVPDRGMVIESVRGPYRTTGGYTWVHLDATPQQVADFHAFMIDLARRGTRTETPARLAYLALTGMPPDTGLRSVTCSQSLVLAARSAHIDLMEPRDARTGELLPSELFLPARLYVCCMNLVGAGRARVLTSDPTADGVPPCTAPVGVSPPGTPPVDVQAGGAPVPLPAVPIDRDRAWRSLMGVPEQRRGGGAAAAVPRRRERTCDL